MKRKSDFNTALDQMFCQDQKKRINAIKMIRQIAATIGPLRVRNQLIPFMNSLIQQLNNFAPLLGGPQHQKCLLPLLINFCFLDQKEVAQKSLSIITQILSRNTDLYLQTIKKLNKPQMSVSKQCTVQLIVSAIKKIPTLQNQLLEIFKGISTHQNPTYRIIASKHSLPLLSKIQKDQQVKIIQNMFNDTQDLVKLYSIPGLLEVYSGGQQRQKTVVVNKIKNLVCMGTWRVNLALCKYSSQFSKILSRQHFRTYLQGAFIKMLNSDDNQIKAAGCSSLAPIAKAMSQQDCANKLLPIVVKISQSKIQFVKNQFAKNFIQIFPFVPLQKINDTLLPLTIKFLKQSSLQTSSNLLNNFTQLSHHFKADKFQQYILKPLATQFAAQNWRLKIESLQILGKIIIQMQVYSNFVVDLLIKQMKSRIQAVRIKATSVIINIIKKSPKDWCQKSLLPQIIKCKDDTNYLIRQRLLSILPQTVDYIPSSYISNYCKCISQLLNDKVANVRMTALRCLQSNRKLLQKGVAQGILGKMRQDSDIQVKNLAKQIKI